MDLKPLKPEAPEGYQPLGAVLTDLSTLGAPASDGQFIVATGAGVFAYESGNTARTSLGLGTGDSPTWVGATFSDNIYVADGQGIFANTSDGSDNARIMIGGGGDGLVSRGGYIILSGNEREFAPGSVYLVAGNVEDADLVFEVPVGERFRVNSTGCHVSGTMTLSGNVCIGGTTPISVLDVIAGSDSTQILWELVVHNEANAAVTGYGAGIKFKQRIGDEDSKKWVGIASVAGSHYSNRTDMVFYAPTDQNNDPVERMRLLGTGGILIPFMKSGTDQANAGADAGELYFDTNDDNTVKIGV